jgi:hypothetical protein
MRTSVPAVLISSLLLALAGVGCASDNEPVPPADAPTDGAVTGDEDDLTSLTARARTLKFAGVVFVDPSASDSSIIATIRKQTQSAFGALREADVGVNSREFKDVDPKTFVKSQVTVIDTDRPGDTGVARLRVSYTFTDTAVVPLPMATRSSLQLAVLNPSYYSQNERVFQECTTKDAHATEFKDGSIWYVFDPALASCRTAINAEQKAVDAARLKLGSSKTQVSKIEAERLYIPSTFSFKAGPNNKKVSYPEYDRLFAGGVEKDKLVIGMVSGMMADWAAGEKHSDYEDQGYEMWFGGLREIFTARPGFKLVKTEPAEDLTTFTAAGKTIKAKDFNEIMSWELDNVNPAGVTYANRDAFRAAIASKLARHWLTFEVPVKVTLNGATKDFTIKLQTYFGAETDETPHKRAIKTSDLFVYNGHSYIGYGPLDPSRFRAGDFPESYQVLMINGCVSYNYYEKDYFPLKTGGTKNLELVTNGLESWVNESGEAMGRYVGAFIDGKLNPYTKILEAAQFTGYGYSWGQDALRVVDGELDNKFSPTKVQLTIQ